MQTRITDTSRTSQNHTSAPQANPFQPKPFDVDTPQKSETPTSDLDFDPASQQGQRYGHDLTNIPIFPPKSTENIPENESYEQQIQRQIGLSSFKPLNVPTFQELQDRPNGKPLNYQKDPVVIPHWAVQSSNSVSPVQAKLTIGQPGDKYEQEADRMASQVVQQINTPSTVQSPPGQSVQRQEALEEKEIQAKSIIQRREAIGGGEASSNEVDSEKIPTTRPRSDAFSAEVTGTGKKYSSDFSDFDSKQFRVSGRAPNRRIEEVKRKQMEDGKVVYYAMGLVTGFNDQAPVIAPYLEPIALGDWYPQVTHINGMAVTPKDGIESVVALQESVNKALDGQNDMALGQDAVDVLYTYSAQRGGKISDLFDCVKGKVGVRDAATEKQEEIMLDAVHRQNRVTVSAHSRGTIKTDNAVRNVHKILTEEYLPAIKQNRHQELVDYWEANNPGISGLDPEALAQLSCTGFAAHDAKTQMNKFIQLIYAGNAVQHPSALIDITMYVGGFDPVSMLVGTYSETGRKIDAAIGTGGSKDSKLHSVGKTKGHGFVVNYVPAVGQEIANDIKKR